MDTPRLQVSERMQSLLAYPKFSGSRPRILVLESGYWLDGACERAARHSKWEVHTIPVVLEGVLPREAIERLLYALSEFKPDFILTINLAGMDVDGLFAGLFEDLRIPYVTWFVDDPRTIVMESNCFASEYATALTWDASYAADLEAAGFSRVYPMPLAVDTTLFNRDPAKSAPLPPTFVGNSMVQNAEREWDWIRNRAPLARAVREALDTGRVTRENFALGLKALLPRGVVEQFDPEERRHAELFLFCEGTRRLRRTLAETLCPEGLRIRGDEAWKAFLPEAGEPIPYMTELPDFYRRCAINLNITSLQMPAAVNQRVFDVPAAGGFLLTDAQKDLDDLFDVEKEVARYHNFTECVELFREYRRHPAFRREIALRARRRILGEHTYAHRLNAIAEIVKERFAD